MRSLCRLPVAKNHNFCANFDILGAPVPTRFYRWVSYLVCYSRPKVYTYPQNFIWMCSLSWLLVAKNHNFVQILTFLGAPVPTPFYRWEPNLVCYSRPMVYAYVPNFASIEKPQFLPLFGLWHLVVSPIGSSLRNLNTTAQLQIIPYPTASKSFLYSSAFTVKSGAQSLTFKTVTNKQTNKQTNKKETSTFLAAPAAAQIRAPPNLAWW